MKFLRITTCIPTNIFKKKSPCFLHFSSSLSPLWQNSWDSSRPITVLNPLQSAVCRLQCTKSTGVSHPCQHCQMQWSRLSVHMEPCDRAPRFLFLEILHSRFFQNTTCPGFPSHRPLIIPCS